MRFYLNTNQCLCLMLRLFVISAHRSTVWHVRGSTLGVITTVRPASASMVPVMLTEE